MIDLTRDNFVGYKDRWLNMVAPMELESFL